MTSYSPKALFEDVERRRAAISRRDFMVMPEHKRLREMWCAARFGQGFTAHIGECLVEVSETDEQGYYDFLLQEQAGNWPFQIAEVLEGGRLRSEEYRTLSDQQLEKLLNTRSPISIDQAASRIQEEAAKKIRKYRTGCRDIHLLLYVNLTVRGLNWQTIVQATANEVGQFASVWLMHPNAFCPLSGGPWAGQVVGWKQIQPES